VNMKTIAVIGWKNSGKTTLVSNLTNYYFNKGIKVGVVKHAHHNFDIDHEGTDSYKIRKSGAFKTTIVSDKRLAHMIEEESLDENVSQIIAMHEDCEILIFEGFKNNSELKKIEVSFKKNNKNELNLELPNVLAIVTDQTQKRTIPNFQHDQIPEIAEFILKIK